LRSRREWHQSVENCLIADLCRASWISPALTFF
jgi:hypothetical protein